MAALVLLLWIACCVQAQSSSAEAQAEAVAALLESMPACGVSEIPFQILQNHSLIMMIANVFGQRHSGLPVLTNRLSL
jgi:hypothetical protein